MRDPGGWTDDPPLLTGELPQHVLSWAGLHLHVVTLDGTHHTGRLRRMSMTPDGTPTVLHLHDDAGTTGKAVPWTAIREVCRREP